MNFRRIWSILSTRNYEFFRDRAALGWNFMFPFLLIGGFTLVFGGNTYTKFKVGIFPCETQIIEANTITIPKGFQDTKHLEFIGFKTFDQGLEKLRHHKIDLLLEQGHAPHRYWLSHTSPKGSVVEKFFQAGLIPDRILKIADRQEIQGREIRYVDWLFPGILAMNMMFSALWGVGYVVVRYRKNGVLKRFKATPLTAFEYLSAQMFSRIWVLMFSIIVVWTGCQLIFSFNVRGSYFDLFVVFFMGSLSLTSLGLVLASRGTSEEFTSGVLNFITWPMMFLSEVWFSIENAPEWIKITAKLFPLTHLLTGVRKIMNDGAGLSDVSIEITILAVMTVSLLSISAAMFSWTK